MPLYTYQCQVCSRRHEELIFFSDYENDNIPQVCGADTYEQGCGGDLHRVLTAPGTHSSWAGTGKHGVNGYFSKALGKHVANKHTEQKIMEGRGFVCEADLPKDRWDTAVEAQKRRVTAQDKTIETYTEALKDGKTKEEAVVEAFPARDAVSGKLDETWGRVNEEMLDAEIGAAEQDEEGAFADMAPRGRFSAKALNNLVKATNRLLPKFGQTPDYPSFGGDITEFPTDFVRVLAMFQGATDDAVEQGIVDDEFAFEFEDITSDGNLMILAGKINKLASDKQYDRYLKSQPEAEGVEEELVDDETTTEDMPPEDVDALFMERM